MPRPRKPLSKAIVSGATMHHPGRFADRTAPRHSRPLGRPYPDMTETEQQFWLEFETALPWLRGSHRVLLRMACRLSARLDSDQEFGVAATKALGSILSKLGATPVDENRVSVPGGKNEDPADRFFARPN